MSDPTHAVQKSRPIILWYCSDQQCFDTIGALGNPHAHTPNLDALVAGGTAFTRAYCQSPMLQLAGLEVPQEIYAQYPRNIGPLVLTHKIGGEGAHSS